MATPRATIGTILNTVNDAAGMVSTTLNTVTTGVNMLSTYVKDMAEEQRIRSIINKDSFIEIAAEEAGMADATRKVQILEFCSKSPAHAEHFNNAYSRVKSLLAETK